VGNAPEGGPVRLSAKPLILLAAISACALLLVVFLMVQGGQGAGRELLGIETATRQETSAVERASGAPGASEGDAPLSVARPDRCLIRLSELKPKWCEDLPKAIQGHMR